MPCVTRQSARRRKAVEFKAAYTFELLWNQRVLEQCRGFALEAVEGVGAGSAGRP